MSMCDALLQEFDNEAATTRRVLERVPSDKLEWKPHPKSMSLGVLALHIAGAPGVCSSWAAEDVTSFKGEPPPTPTSTEQILAAHDNSVKTTKETLVLVGINALDPKGMAEARAEAIKLEESAYKRRAAVYGKTPPLKRG